MNHKIFLSLVATSTLAGSTVTMLLTANLASAVKVSAIAQPASCDLPLSSHLEATVMNSIHHNRARLIASSGQISLEDASVDFSTDFSTAESDAAVALFGCDCPPCINALRQLRRPSLQNNGQGHCWTALQRRVSNQQIEDVLQTLDAEEATQKSR
jgi:hypothetical protein